MTKPLVIDLCCGLGGWTQGFLAEGYRAIGFDIEPFPDYPGELVVGDIRKVLGWAAYQPAVIVASPPCQEFSRHDQPWTRMRRPPYPTLAIELVNTCFRIARQCDCPIVLENVRGAQRFIGPARARYGSQYLWGDVPAILPHHEGSRKNFYWWGKPGDRQADIPVKKQKQSRTSSAVAERSLVPFELAQHVARCFAPAPPCQASKDGGCGEMD